jgi:long-subunit acyl-CoA synthetase (AMP-forming)
LKAARPTKFFAVPRVWEKMQEKMMEAAKKNGTLKRSLVNCFLDVLANVITLDDNNATDRLMGSNRTGPMMCKICTYVMCLTSAII